MPVPYERMAPNHQLSDPRLVEAIHQSQDDALFVAELDVYLETAELLAGGTTNTTWRVEASDGDVVVKLYTTPPSENALFPNNHGDEVRALRLLHSYGLAPKLVAGSSADSEGVPFVVYRYIPGSRWNGEFADAAELLGRLHRPDILSAHDIDELPARQVPMGPIEVLRRSDEMLKRSETTGAVSAQQVARLVNARPPIAAESMLQQTSATPTLIHGDPTPANLIRSDSGLRLIDWQCPAIGDPVHDLAVFLSPLMMLVHGDGPPTHDERQRFLAAYPNKQTAERYLSSIAAWHWQFAVYGACRAGQLRATNPALGALYLRGVDHEVDMVALG